MDVGIAVKSGEMVLLLSGEIICLRLNFLKVHTDSSTTAIICCKVAQTVARHSFNCTAHCIVKCLYRIACLV